MRLRCISCYHFIEPEQVFDSIEKTEIMIEGETIDLGMVRCYGCAVPFDSLEEEWQHFRILDEVEDLDR